VASSVSIQRAAGSGLDLHTLAISAGYLGAALGVLMVLPQIVRTVKNRSLPGVSVLTWALTALSCTTWMLYGLRAHELPQIPGNILMVTGSVVVVLAVPSAVAVRTRAIGLAAPAAVIGGLALVLPPVAIGLIGFVIALTSGLPQLAQSLRRQRGEDSAVSLPAWTLRAVSQVSWLVFAIVLHDVIVTISATFVLSSAIVVVISERRSRPAASLLETIATEVATGVVTDLPIEVVCVAR
jgi:uncharacterized protein with PQ loop repeat